MNNILSEIDTLTKPAFVPASRMGFFASLTTYWNLWRMPRGQRMWALGFKPVTPAEIETRLSIALINEKILRPQVEIAIITSLRRSNVSHTNISEIEIFGVVWYRSIRSIGFNFSVPKMPVVLYGTVEQYGQLAIVKYSKLKEYIGDRIPQRCLDDMKRAKAFGVRDFYVAYPVIDQTPQTDPIIVAKWEGEIGKEGSTMLEISWWE